MKVKRMNILILLAIAIFVSCTDPIVEPIEIQEISIQENKIELQLDDTYQLNCKISPQNAIDSILFWSSGDNSIADVDQNGLVTAKKIGETIISVKTSNNINANCTITVIPIPKIGTWIKKIDIGTDIKRYLAVSFVIGRKLYVGTGSNRISGYCVYCQEPGSYSSGSLKNDFWEYDVDTDVWKKLADFPGGARASAVGFSLNNKGYLGLGTDIDTDFSIFTKSETNEKTDFWEYDPSTDTWRQLTDFPGGGRKASVGFSMNNKGYVGLGSNQGSYLNDFWEFNPNADTWRQLTDFPANGRAAAVGFSIGNFAYVGMGQHNPTNNLPNDTIADLGECFDFWQYSPETNSWIRKAYLLSGVPNYEGFSNFGRDFAVGFSLANKGYVGLGHLSAYLSSDRRDLYQYDPVKDKWRIATDCPFNARGSIAFTIDDRAFLGMGYFEWKTGTHNLDSDIRSELYEFIP